MLASLHNTIYYNRVTTPDPSSVFYHPRSLPYLLVPAWLCLDTAVSGPGLSAWCLPSLCNLQLYPYIYLYILSILYLYISIYQQHINTICNQLLIGSTRRKRYYISSRAPQFEHQSINHNIFVCCHFLGFWSEHIQRNWAQYYGTPCICLDTQNWDACLIIHH